MELQEGDFIRLQEREIQSLRNALKGCLEALLLVESSHYCPPQSRAGQAMSASKLAAIRALYVETRHG